MNDILAVSKNFPAKYLLVTKKKKNFIVKNLDRHILNQVTISNGTNQNCMSSNRVQ